MKRLIEIDELWESDFVPEPDIVINAEPTWYEKIQRSFAFATKWRVRRRKRELAIKTNAPDVRRGEGLEHLRKIKAHK